MLVVNTVNDKKRRLAGRIAAGLSSCGFDLLVLDADGARRYGERSPAAVLTGEEHSRLADITAVGQDAPGELTRELCAPYAVLPGGYLPPGGISSVGVVTYGMHERDTLSFSSVNEDRAVYAVRRDIVTLDGRLVERQEFIGRGIGVSGREDVLAAVAVLLLAGIRPERIGEIDLATGNR